jgi:pyruvate/2-oxoglutarate/acetoin dehydrogenase E1 component
MSPLRHPGAHITVLAISAARLNAREAVERLRGVGIVCDLFHLMWLKPFRADEAVLESLARTGLGLVVDSDFEISGPSRSIAYELMLTTSAPVHALGLADRTGGFAPHFDNGTPGVDVIVDRIRELVERRR